MSEPVAETVDLTRDFGRVRALDGLSLTVEAGSILTLLGPNGAGKTTLLRLLMGLIEPTAGGATVLGAPARRRPGDVSGRIAYVGDRCEPPNWATVDMLEGLQDGAAKDFDRERFSDLCARRGLKPNQRYGSLSKGQRRWVLTSLALASRPRLVLLDEPADGLDPAARRALYDGLRDHVNDTDAAAIVTTHIIADVERVADEVALIDAGRLILHAPLEDLRDRVRQVEFHGRGAAGEMGEMASVLGCVQLGDADVVWIKRNGLSDDDLTDRLGPDVTIRHVNLETLYLAIAEHRPVVEPDARKEAV